MRASIQQANDEVADRDAEISMLVAMGFTVQAANEALGATGGGIDGAIDYLLAVENSLQQDEKQGAIQEASGGVSVTAAENVKATPNEPDNVAIETARRHEREQRASRIHMNDKQYTSGLPGAAVKNVKAVLNDSKVSLGAVAVGATSAHRMHQFDAMDDTIGKPRSKFHCMVIE